MRIGVPKEIKEQEYRVGMTPDSVRALINRGHTVLVQQSAGFEAGFSDEAYTLAGAELVSTADKIFATAELIIKVKELQPQECQELRKDQVLFAYLHLAPDPVQAELLLASGCVAIAYETVTDDQGRLPLLMPSSAVAGHLSVQAGAHCLEKTQGGRGVLLGEVVGAPAGKVVILGGGVVGTEALRVALGMGANVVVLDKSLSRLKVLETLFADSKLTTGDAKREVIEEHIRTADLVIGAVLVPGATAPKLVSRAMLRQMRVRSVIIDVSIDQGGCFETSHATTHAAPTFFEEGVLHYCVANMPAGVPHTATLALNNATLPFIIA
ncbi:MAG TPA: alanine dehydrogenase, partial [Gammaproteobacteria bacterium]|nr:alanine dehydrogenase [Gammaproteobacteria bacterium]